MKRFLSAVLCLMLLFSAVPALAENLCDKEIHFSEFKFGSTYAQVRSQTWVSKIEYSMRILPSRIMCDIANEAYGILYNEMSDTVQFFIDIEERNVAGHKASVNLHFACDPDDRSDEKAVFYAGVYSFMENADATFEDLKGKLSSIYGAPWAEDTSAEAIWGPLTFAEGADWMESEWNDRTNSLSPAQYVVWKSSVNDVYVVLKLFQRFGDTPWTELDYVWSGMDAAFEKMNAVTTGGADANDLEGL